MPNYVRKYEKDQVELVPKEPSNKVVTIPYAPRDWALNFHADPRRFKVLVLHRRAGKTVCSLNHLQRDALRFPNSRYAYIAPTYKQAKQIAWDMIKSYSEMIPDIKYNEQDLTVRYPNGAKITLYGSDNPDSLRGISLNGVIFDEYAQQPANIFSEIIAPTLADKQGYAIWIGTPKGKNEFYNLYKRALEDTNNYYVLHLPASKSGVLPDSELKIQASILSEEEYQQEFECSFEASIRGAYYAKELQELRQSGRFLPINHERGFPVHTWWDLGMADATVIGFFQFIHGKWRLIDYFKSDGMSLEEYVKVVKDKPYIYGEHYAPHDIKVKEFSTGQTRWEVAARLGLRFNILPKIPKIDGINAVRRKLSNLYICSDKCEELFEKLTLYRKKWNEAKGEFEADEVHDESSHFADMIRYWAITDFRPEDNFVEDSHWEDQEQHIINNYL